jgi:hypothetical protein
MGAAAKLVFSLFPGALLKDCVLTGAAEAPGALKTQ